MALNPKPLTPHNLPQTAAPNNATTENDKLPSITAKASMTQTFNFDVNSEKSNHLDSQINNIKVHSKQKRKKNTSERKKQEQHPLYSLGFQQIYNANLN